VSYLGRTGTNNDSFLLEWSLLSTNCRHFSVLNQNSRCRTLVVPVRITTLSCSNEAFFLLTTCRLFSVLNLNSRCRTLVVPVRIMTLSCSNKAFFLEVEQQTPIYNLYAFLVLSMFYYAVYKVNAYLLAKYYLLEGKIKGILRRTGYIKCIHVYMLICC
jgi:hypothetical protein